MHATRKHIVMALQHYFDDIGRALRARRRCLVRIWQKVHDRDCDLRKLLMKAQYQGLPAHAACEAMELLSTNAAQLKAWMVKWFELDS